MSHLDLVRAEIKSWERDFASIHGRDPSVQDIRDHPPIAEKYKLYKRLSKAAATLLRPSRADPVLPLPRFNPFSPTKKSASHSNPFATPSKNNLNSRPRTFTPSPEPPHVSTSAVSRARKRLRGEPVSPSPSKPKRQRVPSRALPPFSKSEPHSPNSEHETDKELPMCNFTSSFVADSPIKAPPGGKSFKLLFDDSLPALPIPKDHAASSAVWLDSPDAGFLRPSAGPPPSHKRHRDLASKGIVSGQVSRASHPQSNLPPMNHHLPASSHKPIFTVASLVTQSRSSMKRTLDSGDPVHDHTELGTSSQSQYLLIPPSPPPQESISWDTIKGKVTAGGRKKLKIESEECDEGVDSSDEIALKVVSLGQHKRFRRHADDLDWDPLLYLGTRNHDPAAMHQIDANHHAPGTFSIDLPDKFRRVLAISPSRSGSNAEERVVRALLYGDRVGHYNPSKGGDIWSAGETDDATNGDVETGDEWEGEPVPWEVGEL